MTLEQCLVEFFALQAKRTGNVLKVSQNETIKKYERYAPATLVNYMNSKYSGSLVRFFGAHTDIFVFIGNKVHLQPHFDAVSLLVNPNNTDIVQFFLGLLQKIGATREQPCSAHILSKYTQYMDHNARLFFHKMYGNSLNIFFTLNVTHFHITSPDRGLVSLRWPLAASNCVTAHLKKCLHKSNAFNLSSGLSMEQLQHEGLATWLPDVRQCFSHGAKTKLSDVLNSYPNIFKWQPREKVWLRKKYDNWKSAWSGAEELLLAVHFMELLKDIGAMSSNPVCFNYILCSTSSVPQECSAYLSQVFPGIDLIDFFHLHPDKFDLSTVNCVSLKCGSDEVVTIRCPELLSAHYAAKLLKYVPDLTPDLFSVCAERAPKTVRTYCSSTVRHRLHTVLDSGRELLASGAIDCTRPIDMIKSICEIPIAGKTKNNGSRKPKMSSPKPPVPVPEVSTNPPRKTGQAPILSSTTEPGDDAPHIQASLASLPVSACGSVRPPVSVPEAFSTNPPRKTGQAPILSSTTEPGDSVPHIQAPIASLPVSGCGSLRLLGMLKPLDRLAKSRSLCALNESVATFGALVRHNSAVISSSQSTMFLPQDAPCGEDCVLELKNDSRKSVTMRRSRSLVCLPVNTADSEALFVVNSAQVQKKSSCVLSCDNVAELSSPSLSPESTNSLAECRKQSQELIITTDKTAEATNDTDADCSDLSSDYMYSKMESVLSEFIKERLEASPSHSENFASLHEAVNKNFGAMCSYEIHLAVLFCTGTLSFDGNNIHYHPN